LGQQGPQAKPVPIKLERTAMSRYWTTYESPLGPLTLIGGPMGLVALRFADHGVVVAHDEHRPELFDEEVAQLHDYFAGARRHFDLRLDLSGTPFQRTVWRHLEAIPYGQTRSYGHLARLLGRPDRARAVGAAVGATPIPIIIPCHRAVAANGALTGYIGGLHRKRLLLDLECAAASGEAGTTVWDTRQLTLL
jgi:methylated-DNA-[protein]-cysteine S-methyltransferase